MKMVVTFINGKVVDVPMQSRRNFNKTKEAINNGEDIIDLQDYMLRIDQIQCIAFDEGK